MNPLHSLWVFFILSTESSSMDGTFEDLMSTVKAQGENNDVSIGIHKHVRPYSAEFGWEAGQEFWEASQVEKSLTRRSEKSLAGGQAHFSQA